MQNRNLDPEKCATLIRAAMAIKQVKQVHLAERTGIHKALLNMFLNRKLNLLPEQIENLITELELQKQVVKLSALM
jgi:hypothetical protein